MFLTDQPIDFSNAKRLLARIGDDWRSLARVRRTALKWEVELYRKALSELEHRGLIEMRAGKVRRVARRA